MEQKSSLFTGQYFNRFMIILVLIFVFILSAELYVSFDSRVIRAEAESRNTARSLKEQTMAIITKVDLAIWSIKKDYEFDLKNKRFSRANLYSNLKAVSQQLPEAMGGIKIVDSKGNLFLDPNPENMAAKINIFDREHFQKHLQNPDSGLIISRPLLSRTEKVYAIVLSRRIDGLNREFDGIVTAIVPVTIFDDFFGSLDMGRHGHLYILNKLGDVLSKYPKGESTSEDFLKNFIPKEEKGHRSGQIKFSLGWAGDSKILTYEFLRDFPVAVVVELSELDYLSSWKIKAILYVNIVIALFLLIWFSYRRNLQSEAIITEQRIQMVQAAKLSALGEMASGMAHEINTPLAIISASAEYLQDVNKVSGTENKEIDKGLEKIINMTHRVSRIIKGLRSYARNAAHDPMIEVNIEQILEETLDLCREQINEKGIQLFTDFKSPS